MRKVALGLSGGVDSAVSAALLLEQGYHVTGVFLECYNTPGCRTDSDRKDALEVALNLKIPFQVLDFKQAYQEKVIAYFLAEYRAGRTPNPDVVCNREIKFGLFYDWAMREGYDYVATGHYARVATRHSLLGNAQTAYSAVSQAVSYGGQAGHYARVGKVLGSGFRVRGKGTKNLQSGTSSLALLRAVDATKDQSYFLCQLRQEQLKHILFPLGNLTKAQVRHLAQEKKLPVAAKPDSQGICFIGEVRVDTFLQSLGVKKVLGNMVIRENKKLELSSKKYELGELVVGRHRGAWFYTVGQRMGLQMSDVRFQISERQKRDYKQNLVKAGLDPSNLPPLFVIEKDVARNQLVVGLREQLFTDHFRVERIQWIDEKPELGSKNQAESGLRVRIRHLGELVAVRVIAHTSHCTLYTSQPLYGVAPGQIAVFYDDEVVVGWATIA